MVNFDTHEVINIIEEQTKDSIKRRFIGSVHDNQGDMVRKIKHAVYQQGESLRAAELPLVVAILNDHDKVIRHYNSNTRYLQFDNVRVEFKQVRDGMIHIKYDAILNDPELKAYKFEITDEEKSGSLSQISSTNYDL